MGKKMRRERKAQAIITEISIVEQIMSEDNKEYKVSIPHGYDC